jgi:hypothetical protein
MAYATVDELAGALRLTVTPGNTAALQRCLDAAAREIDDTVDAFPPVAPDPPWTPAGDDLALVKTVNILRGVEWWKSNDAAFGVMGFADTGALKLPRSTFARHAAELLPVKQQWGIG